MICKNNKLLLEINLQDSRIALKLYLHNFFQNSWSHAYSAQLKDIYDINTRYFYIGHWTYLTNYY